MKQKHIETPWGPSQSQREHAPGIVFHSTASHGGYHLSTDRWKDFTAIPQFANWPAPWLEEDCDAALVYLRWPELATDEQIHDAICMARAVASWKGNEEGRWALLVAWIEQRPELLARAQAHADSVKHLWQRGSMSTMNHKDKRGLWCVSFRRGDERRDIEMDYPTKRYYTDEELEALAQVRPSPAVPCEHCQNGRWETECCNGANGCDCRGERVDMGACNVCGGTGMRRPDANTRANIEAIQGRCFIGRGPTSGYWVGWEGR